MAKLQLNDVLLNINLLHVPFIITGVFVVYFFVYAFYQIYFSPLSKIPAPWYAVISDLWLKFHTLAGRRVFVVHELHKKYGPYVRISPTETDISDIDSVKQIHSPQDPYRKSDWYGPLTDGINGVYALLPNDAHRARRRAWGNAWSNTNISMMEPAVRKYVYICAEKINRELEAGRKPDLMHWFQFLTTDVIAEISYGKDMGMLENETVSSFVQDLLAILVIGAIRAQFPFLGMVQKIMSYIPHPKIQWFINANKRISDYSDQAILDYRREVQSARDKKGNLRPSLLATLLDDLDNPNVKHKMTMEEIRWEATDNLIGGSDTVTITATYLIWAIYRHPNVRAKLETELRDAIDGQEITDERIQHLPYLKIVIKEVLRLYSAGQFGLPRVVPDGGRFIGGYYFPAGTNVTSQGYTVHRDPKVFDDPYAFKPERWLNPTKEMENSHMPWGGYSRSCLGQNLAMMELRLIAAVMLTVCPSATLAESCTDDSMELENYFVLRPKGHKCELVSSR